MMFAPDYWCEFKADTPLLYRHRADEVAGRVLGLKATPDGLRVKARISLPAAKTAPAFSLAAVVHVYKIVNRHDPARVHALITDASLEEISMVTDPANSLALVKRSRAGSLDALMAQIDVVRLGRLKQVDLFGEAIAKVAEIVEHMMVATAATPPPRITASRPAVTDIPATHPHIYGRIPPRPSRATEFSRLASELNSR
jgi:hypothetical protein